jgi:tropomyosin, fungi type
MTHLRAEADAANERADIAEARLKKYELDSTARDQELSSLHNKVAQLEEQLETMERELKTTKERCAAETFPSMLTLWLIGRHEFMIRSLNLVDVKAEQFERRTQHLELERDALERKNEVRDQSRVYQQCGWLMTVNT